MFIFSWYDPLGYGCVTGRRRLNRISSGSLKGGSILNIPAPRAGPLVGTQNMHKKLAATNSYHSNVVCWFVIHRFFNHYILKTPIVVS